MQNCGFCGRFLSEQWQARWACFAYEAAAFCEDCHQHAPQNYLVRQAWGRQAGLMSAEKASDYCITIWGL